MRSAAVFWTTVGDGRDVLYLPGAPVESGDFFSAAAVNNFGIERVRRDVAVFNRADRMPVPEINFAIIAATGNAHRAAFLLAAANAVWKVSGHADVIELRGGLVVPGTPSVSTVHGDQGALIADQQDRFRIVRVDPDVLIIIAARSAAKTDPGFCTVC